MSRLSLFAIVILTFGIGWYAGQKSVPTPEPTAPPPIDTKGIEAQRLLEDGAKEIAAISDENLRRQKAEELLEKMLKLFMIDLSLRLQRTEAELAAKPAEPPPAPTHPPARPEKEFPNSGQAPTTAPTKGLTPEQRRRFEMTVVNSDNPSDINRALRELAKLPFDDIFKGSKDPTPQQTESLFGTFSGQVIFYDGRPPWRLRIQLSPEPGSTLEYPSYVSVIHVTNAAGKNSQSRGRGSLKGFSVGSQDPLMFFVESGDDVFQLYKSKSSAGFVGLLFEAEGKRNMKASARVTLEQR
jgi:hypothetical protein